VNEPLPLAAGPLFQRFGESQMFPEPVASAIGSLLSNCFALLPDISIEHPVVDGFVDVIAVDIF